MKKIFIILILTLTLCGCNQKNEEKDIKKAVDALKGQEFDSLILCIAGWIPTHAVLKVTEHYRHLPMVLWGLCGWYEGDRLLGSGVIKY